MLGRYTNEVLAVHIFSPFKVSLRFLHYYIHNVLIQRVFKMPFKTIEMSHKQREILKAFFIEPQHHDNKKGESPADRRVILPRITETFILMLGQSEDIVKLIVRQRVDSIVKELRYGTKNPENSKEYRTYSIAKSQENNDEFWQVVSSHIEQVINENRDPDKIKDYIKAFIFNRFCEDTQKTIFQHILECKMTMLRMFRHIPEPHQSKIMADAETQWKDITKWGFAVFQEYEQPDYFIYKVCGAILLAIGFAWKFSYLDGVYAVFSSLFVLFAARQGIKGLDEKISDDKKEVAEEVEIIRLRSYLDEIKNIYSQIVGYVPDKSKHPEPDNDHGQKPDDQKPKIEDKQSSSVTDTWDSKKDKADEQQASSRQRKRYAQPSSSSSDKGDEKIPLAPSRKTINYPLFFDTNAKSIQQLKIKNEYLYDHAERYIAQQKFCADFGGCGIKFLGNKRYEVKIIGLKSRVLGEEKDTPDGKKIVFDTYLPKGLHK